MMRWASFPERDHPDGRFRHLVQKGHPTSLCGTTALPVTMWRGNSRKPPCPRCFAMRGVVETEPGVRWICLERGIHETLDGGFRVEQDGKQWVALELVQDCWSWVGTRNTLRAAKADLEATAKWRASLTKGRAGSESGAALHRERDVQALVGTTLPQATRMASDTSGE